MATKYDVNLDDMVTAAPVLRADVHLYDGTTFHYSIAQNTPEWDNIRRGRITGSKADLLLVSPFTKAGKRTVGSVGSLSKGAINYAYKIAMEIYCPTAGVGEPRFYGADMQRGHDEELPAALAFEEWSGFEVEDCGFVSIDEHIGASPDKLIKNYPAGLEMKSAKAEIHFKRLLDMDSFVKEHYAQVQFCMMVTGYDTWFLTSFNPSFDKKDQLLVKIIDRDEEVISVMRDKSEEMIEFAKNITESIKTKHND